MTILNKLFGGLSKSGSILKKKIITVLSGRRLFDDETIEAIEEILYEADIGVKNTEVIITRLQKEYKGKSITDIPSIILFIKQIMRDILERNTDLPEIEKSIHGPEVFLVFGVNGVGKTTSIGKLANRFKQEGKTVLLIAADTFRAAAIDQIGIWAERNQIDIVKHQHLSDPSAVIYDGLQAAIARKIDIVLIDTAGRLHNKKHLMEEFAKIVRTIQKLIPSAPHHSFIVIDGTLGQNSINQAKSFQEIISISGAIISKLDGTAKGGVIFSIMNDLKIPIRYIGTGEGINDIELFNPDTFIEGFFAYDG